MNRIKKEFNLVFSDEQSPYFQVSEDKRLAIPLNLFKGQPIFAKQFVSFLFNRNSEIDATFLKFYILNNSKKVRFFEKYSLHKSTNIKNWEENLVRKEDSKVTLGYVTIKNLLSDEVYKYFLAVLKGKKSSFIGFYNNEYLIMIDSDEVVIIAKNFESIEQVNQLIQKFSD